MVPEVNLTDRDHHQGASSTPVYAGGAFHRPDAPFLLACVARLSDSCLSQPFAPRNEALLRKQQEIGNEEGEECRQKSRFFKPTSKLDTAQPTQPIRSEEQTSK